MKFRLVLILLAFLLAALAVQACVTTPSPPGGGGGVVPSNPTAVPTEDTPEATDAPGENGAGGDPGSTGGQGTVELDTVKVITLPFLSFAPFYIGLEEGHFADHGINIELVNMTVQQEILPALASGQVDVSSGLLSAGIFNTIAGGGNIRIVADKGFIEAGGCPNIALIAAKSFAESTDLSDPENLRGKEIDVVRSTWIEYYLDTLLTTVGLSVGDIVEVDIPSTSELDALANGSLLLTTQNEPWVTRMLEAGHVAILTPVDELMPDSQSAVLLYGPSLLGPDTDLGVRFMAAYLESVRQYQEGKTARNVEILAKHLGLDEALLQAMCWQPLRVNGAINGDSAEAFQAWAAAAGYVQSPVAPEDYYDSRFVDGALGRIGTADQ